MNRKAWMELALLLFLVTVVNFVWSPADLGFTQNQPHPYLLIVLLIAVRHGVMAALVTIVVLCTTLIVFSQQNDPSLSPSDLFFRPWNFVLANWIVLGATIGAVADAKRRQMEDFQTKLKYMESDFQESKKRLDLTEAENIELRKKVFGKGETLTTVYEMARRLITLTGKDLFQASLDLVEKFAGATQCSIYLLDRTRQRFELQTTRGLGHFSPPATVARGDALFEKSLREWGVVSIKELFSAEKSRQMIESVMVAPIGEEGGGEAQECGVLVIHRLPIERLNAQTVGVVRLLADWISRSLNLVQRFEATEDPNAELTLQMQKMRFTTAFIQTLSRVSAVEDRAFEVLCSDQFNEIAYWNASKMLKPSTKSNQNGSEGNYLSALDVLLSNGSHLGAVLVSLPIHPHFYGCEGLRLRIQERAELNAQAATRLLTAYVSQFHASSLPALLSVTTEKELSRRQYFLDNLLERVEFLSQRKHAVAYCLGLNRPDSLKVTTADLLLSLTHDPDRWTKRLAALASYELQLKVNRDVVEALIHSESPLDAEIGVRLSTALATRKEE